MPSYHETVRAELERLDDLELQQRLMRGHLTDEAHAIATSILAERGAPLVPVPSPPRQPIANPVPAPSVDRSPFLGIGILATFVGLSVVFNSSDSLGYAVGRTFGHFLGAAVVALPLFLVWRFFVPAGRRQSLSTGFNVFAALVGAVWFLLFMVAAPLLPKFLELR